MKKLFATLVAICSSLSHMAGYAVPDDGADVMISQMDAVDYIMLIGGGIFLIGLLLILLSMYAGLKNKKDVYDTEDDYEAEYEEEHEETVTDDSEAVSGEVEEVSCDETEAPETENTVADEPEEENKEEEIVETESEEVAEVIEETETQSETVVRLTLTGTNNADVKIAEFTQSAKVGRRGTNDIMISDNAVSGEHCEFIYDDGIVYLRDLDSTNGTLLNGEAIEKEEIKTGDLIIIGKHQYKVNISL